MSPDWSKTPEGVPYADLSNPQSLNLYGYVGNNPLSREDDDGHKENTPAGQPGAPGCNGSNTQGCSNQAQQQNTTQKQTTSFVNSDRVKLAATGIGNVIVGVGKAVAAAGALAAAPETGGLTVPLAGYAAIGAGGNLAAGGAQIVGAITGHVAEASKGADAAAAVTTFSGAITLARTGSVEKASTAAAVEGVFSFGFTGGATGNLLGASRLEKVSTVIDASQNVQQLIMTPVASH
jgi:hypothetical protein